MANATDTARISLEKTADMSASRPGGTLNYIITVINDGPAAAKTPTVSDALPAMLENAQFIIDGAAWAPWPGSVVLPDIPAGKRATVWIQSKVKLNATGNIANEATLTTPTPGPDGANTPVTAAVNTPVISSADQTSDLVTSVTSNNDAPKPGDIVTYTVTIRNNGPANAPSPTVEFEKPPALGSIEYSLDGAAWKPWEGKAALADIPNGGSVQLFIRGEVPVVVSGNAAHTLSITARSINSDPNTADNTAAITTTVTPAADLHTTVTADNANPKPGDTIVYTVSVRNNGPSTAQTPRLSLSPSAHLTNVEYSFDGGTYLPWTGGATLPDIPSGGEAKLLIRGTVSEAAVETIEMVFAATSEAGSQSNGNNAAAVQTPVAAKSCAVTFADCGCQSVVRKVAAGQPIAKPEAPVEAGYTFVGWFTRNGRPWNFSCPVNSDMKLYAKWRACR